MLKLTDLKLDRLTGLLPDENVSELRRRRADGFRVRDLFYSRGLYAILERQAKTPAAQDPTASR